MITSHNLMTENSAWARCALLPQLWLSHHLITMLIARYAACVVVFCHNPKLPVSMSNDITVQQ